MTDQEKLEAWSKLPITRLRQICRVREDGRLWYGCEISEHDSRGVVVGWRVRWHGYYTMSSRGIDDPEIRKGMPWRDRLFYFLGFYGRKLTEHQADARAITMMQGMIK